MNATIVMACRDPGRAIPAAEEISRLTDNSNIEFMKLDLDDLDSVKDFSQKLLQKYQKINILINNAGVMCLPNKIESKNGFEMQLATNHIGHFYLTKQLLNTI